MHVQFQDLTLSRFRSFQEKSTFTFAHAGKGLYFLKGRNEDEPALGSNDAGKSTVIDALFWCLYGRTVMGLRNPDIVPWHGKGSTFVEIGIVIDKKVHIVKRTIAPNLLTIDGKEVGQDSVERLIGIPYEILPYTVIHGQRQPFFFDQGATEKLKIFSECLNLARWEDRSETAKTRSKALQTEIHELEIQLRLMVGSLVVIKEDIESAKAKKDLWEKERQIFLDNITKERKAAKLALESLTADRGNHDLALESAEVELRGSNFEKYQRAATAAQVECSKLKISINAGTQERSRIENDLIKVDEDVCPVCNQGLNNLAKRELKKELKKVLKQQNLHIKLDGELYAKNKEVLERSQAAAEIERKVALQFREKADNARDMLLRLNKSIAEQEAKLANFNTASDAYEHEPNPYGEQLKTYKTRLVETQDRIEQSETSIIRLKADLDRTQYWIKGFKDIKLLTIENILQELEIVTGGMLEEFGLGQWRVTYDIERENKDGTIAKGLHVFIENRKTGGKRVKWESWGGGVAQRLNIIGTCALASVLLNHLGVTTNLEIYDEPTQSLSGIGVSNMVELLSQRADDYKKTIWLVDHHVIESRLFIDTVTIVKNAKGSQIQCKADRSISA